MDTNTMYIEHYIDLHNYISDNIYELNDDVIFTEAGLTLLALAAIPINFFGNIILSGLYKSLYNTTIKKELKSIENFKNNFKKISLSKEQIDSIINDKKYSKLKLKENNINKIIKALNSITDSNCPLNDILKDRIDVKGLSCTIVDMISACLFFTTSFMKGIVPKSFKEGMFLYILKFSKDIGKLELSNSGFITSINAFLNKKMHTLSISNVYGRSVWRFIHLWHMKHSIKNISQIKETINKYAQEKGLSQELNEYLEKNYPKMNLGEAIQESLETMMDTLKFILHFKLFLQLCIDIIDKNN